MRKALSIVKIVAAAIGALLFAAWILLQTPKAQTLLAGKLLAGLESRLGGSVGVSQLRIRPFNAVVAKDLVILDKEPAGRGEARVDTIFSAGTVVATFSIDGLLRKEGIHFSRAVVKDGSFTLTSEKSADGENASNLKRFLNRQRPKVKKEPGEVFDIRKVRVENFRFRLLNLVKRSGKDFGIDWTDLDVLVRRLEARSLKLSQGYMYGELKSLSASEKSGYNIQHLSGRAKVGHGRTLVEEIRLLDDWSELDLPLFSMSYTGPKAFRNFVDEVRMELDARQSGLSSKSLSFFAPSLRGLDIFLDLAEAQARGSVNELEVGNLGFVERGSGIQGEVSCILSGTTRTGSMEIDSRIGRLVFSTASLEDLLGRTCQAGSFESLDLERFAAGERLVLSGTAKGPLDDLRIESVLSTERSGVFRSSIEVRNQAGRSAPLEMRGTLATESLDLGKLAGIQKLGRCTMRAGLSSRLDGGRASVSIDSLLIDQIDALDYSYSNIAAVGTYSQNAFNGRVVCNDPNLSFLFQGILTFSDKTQNRLYKFYANVGYADLQALKLDKRGGKSQVSGQVNANYMSISRGDIIGSVKLDKVILESDTGRHDIGAVSVESHSNNDIHRVNLSSSFATASFVGAKPLGTLAGAVKELTLQRWTPSLVKARSSGWKGQDYEVKADIHDARDILSFALPGVFVAEKTAFRLNMSKEGEVVARVESPRLAKGRNFLKDFSLSFDNKDGKLEGTLSSSLASTSLVDFADSRIHLQAKDDNLVLDISYDNGTPADGKGDIHLTGDFGRDQAGRLSVRGKTLPSSILYNGEEWKLSSSSIDYVGAGARVDNLTARSGRQSVSIDGGFSSTRRDTLSLELSNFNLGLVNKFLSKDFGIGGTATGKALLTSPTKDKTGLVMSLRCDSTMVAGRRVGKLMLGSSIDAGDKMRLIARNELDGARSVNLSGELGASDGKLDVHAELDGLDLGYLSPLLSGVFDEVGGKMSGKVRIGGEVSRPQISSEGARIESALLKVGFTNVPYTIDGPISISDKGVTFSNLAVSDRFDGKGSATGGLYFGSGPLRLDTKISMERMECLNTSEADNPSFYGRVFAGGDVRISGPLDAILLDINATTSKESEIHIPVAGAGKDRTGELLFFKELVEEVESSDPYEELLEKLETAKQKDNDFGVRLRVRAGPQLQAFVEIDKAAGNVLSGRGQGLVDINVRPSRDIFTINGDYSLSDGNFHFNAMNIAQRDFSIKEGSSIRFNGDVMDSDLSIEGVYSTKASVATLIADTTSVSSRRLVNCGIGISGKLKEPDLSFRIDVPDLDPTTKSKVESALNTDDKIQRQFLTLLISGSFMPEEQSGIVNNTNALYNNVAEIMAGQLNNILQKLDIPLDLGLNYQSKESGTDIFDVAVSTKLFNDRVLVNGAFGNREYSTNRDVAGDLDIEIKLDKPGQLRLNLFSHSADSYTSYLDNTQRSGIGVTYQKEFNTFKEFFHNLFSSKKKKSEARSQSQQPEGAGGARETKTIVIYEYD